MTKKALVVGINYYGHQPLLLGCVNDAKAVARVLAENGDGTPNFDVLLMTGKGRHSAVTRAQLKQAVSELFQGNDVDAALFYFAGHGCAERAGGYLITSECRDGDEGFSLNDLYAIVSRSSIANKVVVLDSCQSGVLASRLDDVERSDLRDGVTILSADSTARNAAEEKGQGLFTRLFVDALKGEAATATGEITPISVFAHIEQAFGPWDQRPLVKMNGHKLFVLRTTTQGLDCGELKKLTQLFPKTRSVLDLSPKYLAESRVADRKMVDMFAAILKGGRLRLIVPVDAPDLYSAALTSKSCRLTSLGRHRLDMGLRGEKLR